MKIANRWTALVLGIGGVAVALALNGQVRAGEAAVVIAAPVVDVPAGSAKTETAVFAGGCFWGVQGVFQHVRGVTNAVSGYAGGKAATARYELVGSGATGHAEAVQVTYDPTQISYGKLLQIFFSVAHDPTQLNRQGPDSGTQYRSAIFPASPVQRNVAEKYIAQLNASHAFRASLATTIEADTGFFVAEAYHQNYLTLHPNEPYIAINDLPKVENLKRVIPNVYRPDPVLVRRIN
ncbi:MAG: peptide-methionine (S)-S-oxide reductase MsrA [Pseudomonadota bacterium]